MHESTDYILQLDYGYRGPTVLVITVGHKLTKSNKSIYIHLFYLVCIPPHIYNNHTVTNII